MKRLIRLVLMVLTAFVILLTFARYVYAAMAPRYETGGMEFMDETEAGKKLYEQEKDKLPKLPDGSIPPQWKKIQGLKLYINYRLWKDMGILCYGNYKSVPGNDFKPGTQPPGQPERHGPDDGYYANPNGGRRGEWRYHGWDVSGNKLTNIFFIPDSVVTKFNERYWIKNPWNSLPENKRVRASIYNDVAITIRDDYDTTLKSGVQAWINKSLANYGGVPLAGGAVDPEVYRYLNVESAPTITKIGQGRMWHRRPDDTIWYQTIAIPTLEKSKKDLPVEVKLELLTAIDKVQDVGAAMDDKPLNLRFRVTAVLKDEDVYNDEVKKTVYYTRDDIEYWTLYLNDTDTQPNQTELPQQQVRVPAVGNTGSSEFTLKTTYGVFRKHNWNLYVTAKGVPTYRDNKTGNKDYAGLDIGITTVKPQEPPVRFVEDFVPDPRIPEIAFEGVPFEASDYTDMSKVESRKVYVDGIEVDDGYFFSGRYIFPGTVGENGRFAYVDCEYKVKGVPGDAGKVVTRDVVYIYPTKPIANFRITSKTWKQNRIINVQNTSNEANIKLVLQKYPIVEYEWSYGGNTEHLRKGKDTDLTKELMYKEPGFYSLTLRCKNTLGRWSDPYTVSFQVLEDVAPAVGLNLSSSVYTRNEKVDAWYYFVASTDGDVIKSSVIELWYDSDNDGTVDVKLDSWNNREQFPAFTPTRLGYYKYVLTAKEDITDDTLPQYITEEDKKAARYEVEFWVDNYRPLSDLYLNIPIQRPNIDIYFMLDKNLDPEMKDYMLNNRINMSNWLLGKNIIPNVNIWDMRTYTYSQPASTSVNTGSSYPPSTMTYSSNGYSGTLSLTSVSNNRYSRDEGSYQTRTESKTVTATGSGYATITYVCGQYGGWVTVSSSESNTPSMSYSDGEGFSGTLYKTSYTLVSDTGPPPTPGTPGQTYTQYKTYSATYSGTVYRTVQVWVPNIVWYDNYTGFYSGTIYKHVRQPYTDPFNPTSKKYVVYISNNTISELQDLNMVMGYAKTASLLLAGSDSIKSQRAHEKYFSISGKTMDAVIDEILQYIAENSPGAERYYLLQNESFIMNVGHIDLENDEIVEQGMQYIHEPDYFDNPTGREPGTVPEFNENSGWTSEIKSSFANTGKYTIYRRVKDRPSTDPRFANYSYYSANTYVEVYVVRKPIAKAILDWDYDPVDKVYKTRWVDQSYDPDHQYSHPDKGIADRSIKWRRTGGNWHYGIPDNLEPGTYELWYYVLDIDGYWSDPFVMHFTLEESPAMQFKASLRALDNKFSLSGIPASEYLEAYDLWTRFPYNVRLQMAMYSGNSAVTPVKTITYSGATGNKTGNDIIWNNVIYQVPETLPDNNYEFRISAIGENGRTAIKSFTVKVSTPLDLEPSMPYEVVGGTTVEASAKTSKYANVLNAVLFYGTPYEKTFSLTCTGKDITGSVEKKNWEGSFQIPFGIPDGVYTARFTAIAPNGSRQTKETTFKLINLAITEVNISGYWNHWRGQTDILGKRLTNEPHRFLSLERVKIDITTAGNPDYVTIRFSPELEAMRYTDPNGHVYDYDRDFFGYKISFPADTTFTPINNHVHWEYHLPLAPSTKSWDNTRLRPPYRMIVTAVKGEAVVEHVVDDIDITGNIYDLTYIQPK